MELKKDYQLISRRVTDVKLVGIPIDDFEFGLSDGERPKGYDHVGYKMFGHYVTEFSYNSEIDATLVETYRLKD